MRRISPPFAIAFGTLSFLLVVLLLDAATALSAQERVKSHIFEIADADHNQLISETEYHAAMQRRFEQLDTNKDGNLSRQEMDQARANTRERLQGLRGGGQLAN